VIAATDAEAPRKLLFFNDRPCWSSMNHIGAAVLLPQSVIDRTDMLADALTQYLVWKQEITAPRT
jgi:hypothetical protein